MPGRKNMVTCISAGVCCLRTTQIHSLTIGWNQMQINRTSLSNMTRLSCMIRSCKHHISNGYFKDYQTKQSITRTQTSQSSSEIVYSSLSICIKTKQNKIKISIIHTWPSIKPTKSQVRKLHQSISNISDFSPFFFKVKHPLYICMLSDKTKLDLL